MILKRILRLFLAVGVLTACAAPALAGGGTAPVPVPIPTKSLPNLPFLRPVGVNNVYSDCCIQSNSGTDYALTSRTTYTTVGGITRMQLITQNNTVTASAETSGIVPIVREACVEYPLGTLVQCFSLAGKSYWVEDPTASYTITDELGVTIPAASTFAVRLYTSAAKPPTSPSATATVGGVLTSGTTYYYKVTTVDSGLESNPTSEVSTTASGSNLSVTISLTPNGCAQPSGWAPRPCTQNIYRGTSPGSETYLTSIPGAAMSWTDSGYLTTAAGVSAPTVVPQVQWNGLLHGGWSNNIAAYGGTQSNILTATGAISGATGPGQRYTSKPAILLGNDGSATSIMCDGDSICLGIGIPVSFANAGTSIYPSTKNWFDAALDGVSSYAVTNESVGGAQACDFNTPRVNVRFRAAMEKFAGYLVTDLGTNDIYAGTPWQTVAQCHLNHAQALARYGTRYVITTLTPRTTSTTGFTDLAHQFINGTYEPARVAYNDWCRAGAPVNASGAPVAAGTSGAMPSPLIRGCFDMATAAGEVNSSGTPTTDGGYWPAPGVAVLSTTLTGTPTTTNLPFAASATSDLYDGMAAVMSSGADSGQVATIARNSGQTLTVYTNGATTFTGNATGTGLNGAPSSGDALSIFNTYTVEGIHPTLLDNGAIASAFATWATANLLPFQAS